MSTLTNKFIHITGSIPLESSSHDVELARGFIQELATEILRQDGGLVVLVNKGEPNSAIPFDWDMIAVVSDFETTYRTGRTLLRTVRRADYQSMLSESQKVILGRIAQNTVDITIPTYQWTGGAIRERQAGQSSAAIVIGGSRGVEDTADLMQDAGKPVLPLNFYIGWQPTEIGGTRLYQNSLTYPQSYMPKTYDRLLARTDALVIQDDTSAKRVCPRDHRDNGRRVVRPDRNSGERRIAPRHTAKTRCGLGHNYQGKCLVQHRQEHPWPLFKRLTIIINQR